MDLLRVVPVDTKEAVNFVCYHPSAEKRLRRGEVGELSEPSCCAVEYDYGSILHELCVALGWQGGTRDAAMAEVRSLVKFKKEHKKKDKKPSKREELCYLLSMCTESQVDLFKRMYANGNMDLLIVDVVKAMPVKKLDWAIKQVADAVEKNMSPKKEGKLPEKEVESEESRVKRIVEKEAIRHATESFYEEKDNTRRDCVGGKGNVSFSVEDKEYTVSWDGWWESSDWYDYEVPDVMIKGTKFLD